MNRQVSGTKIRHHRLAIKTAILIGFTAILLSGPSCDDVALFTFADDMAHYGPTWSFDDLSTTVTINFPDEVINADNANNYKIINYTGDGSITIAASYGDTNRIVYLNLAISGTTTSTFSVQIVTSRDTLNNSTSITTMNGNVLQDYTSPSFYPGCFYGCVTP
jgi:hypothetical protein